MSGATFVHVVGKDKSKIGLWGHSWLQSLAFTLFKQVTHMSPSHHTWSLVCLGSDLFFTKPDTLEVLTSWRLPQYDCKLTMVWIWIWISSPRLVARVKYRVELETEKKINLIFTSKNSGIPWKINSNIQIFFWLSYSKKYEFLLHKMIYDFLSTAQ